MTVVSVCVGSSCHLKGSYTVMQLFKKAIEDNNLEEKVELKAAFCMGQCQNGVCVTINDDVVLGVTADNFDEIFKEHILSKQK